MQQVGRHSFRIEENVFYIKYVAAVTLDELKQMNAIAEPLRSVLPFIYLVYDVSEAGLMTPPARRYAAERSRELQCPAMLIHGTTPLTRAAIALVLSAVRLIGKEIPKTVYVDSEREARAWIAGHRLAQSSATCPG